MNRIDKVRVATATFLALLVVQTGVCLTSRTSRFNVQGRSGNHNSEQTYDKIASLSGSATTSQEKYCSQHPLNTSYTLISAGTWSGLSIIEILG